MIGCLGSLPPARSKAICTLIANQLCRLRLPIQREQEPSNATRSITIETKLVLSQSSWDAKLVISQKEIMKIKQKHENTQNRSHPNASLILWHLWAFFNWSWNYLRDEAYNSLVITFFFILKQRLTTNKKGKVIRTERSPIQKLEARSSSTDESS